MNEDENEQKRRIRGERLNKNEAKIEIVKYILIKNDVVSGPDIIKHIQKKYNLLDENNIRSHLKGLKQKGCIEIIPRDPGSYHKWKIEKLETLRNIRKHYPEIQLNRYDQALNLILEEQIIKGYPCIDAIHAKELRIQLSHSIHFFDKCLKNSFKTLYDDVEDIYSLGKRADSYENFENHAYEFPTQSLSQTQVPSYFLDFLWDIFLRMERHSLYPNYRSVKDYYRL